MATKLRLVLRIGDSYYHNAGAKHTLYDYLNGYRRSFPVIPGFKSTTEKIQWIFEHLERVIAGPRELWMFREPEGCSTRKSGWRQTLEAVGMLRARPKKKKPVAPPPGLRYGVYQRPRAVRAPAPEPPAQVEAPQQVLGVMGAQLQAQLNEELHQFHWDPRRV